jgi:hypothetical protein
MREIAITSLAVIGSLVPLNGPCATLAVLSAQQPDPVERSLAPQPIAQSTIEAVDVELEVEFTDEQLAYYHMQTMLDRDFDAMQIYRPGYSFWQHVFTIPDGSVAFGSAEDGRLLAVFPSRGDWIRGGRWVEESLSRTLAGAALGRRLSRRRDQVELLLTPVVGEVVHNETRGNFLRPNTARYGGFLREWGAIYERFGVPAEIGLAQAAVESGLDGRIRSEARALGFCQWLEGNWNRLKSITAGVIEGYNQTTQAPYCAAYLAVLATKYRTFIPALSEHHAGGTNVGRTIINGQRLGGENTRDQYLLGSRFALDLRNLSTRTYRDVVRTYGPRSYRYAEMIFGNAQTIRKIMSTVEQVEVYAIKASKTIPIEEVVRKTGLSRGEVRRYNPALVRRVPAGANLYLPFPVDDFGPDASFWHRPPTPEYAAVLNEFVHLDHSPDEWALRSFEPVLIDFQRRFQATDTEEGMVMGAVIEYYRDEAYRSSRSTILAEFRASDRIRELFERGVRERAAVVPLSGAGGR